MLDFEITYDNKGVPTTLTTSITGKALLSISALNKGTAFSADERSALGLQGKLPNRIETLEEQVERAYVQYSAHESQIDRNAYLNHLLNNNQVLFYKLISLHLPEMLPTIYTPIVGNAVQLFHKRFMEPRGLYIAYTDQDQIEMILKNRTNPEIDLLVVSDGEGILGIGDQGIGGMAIPIAKLMVYTAVGGINPLRTLPILLDAGTNNEDLLNDPFYLGWRHPRISGDQYHQFIDKFVRAVQKLFPRAFLHWEDFGRANAYQNLNAYRNQVCSFNDDIQGTGVVATATILSAIQHAHFPLAEQRILLFGAGTAGMGIVSSVYAAFLEMGLTPEIAKSLFFLVDREGLLTTETENTTPAQQAFLRPTTEITTLGLSHNHCSLAALVEAIKPTILIGTSAQTGAFSETVVKTMAKHVQHPVILALSNPPEKAEALPVDLVNWTEGRAWIATGSPFEPVVYQGRTIPISQCNNYLAFPGIGLGVLAVKAARLTDRMLSAASKALGELSATDHTRLLPGVDHAHDAANAVATAVAEAAVQEGVAAPGMTPADIPSALQNTRWEPRYLPYRLK